MRDKPIKAHVTGYWKPGDLVKVEGCGQEFAGVYKVTENSMIRGAVIEKVEGALEEPETIRDHFESLPWDHPLRVEFEGWRAYIADLKTDLEVMTRVRDSLIKKLDDQRAEFSAKEAELKRLRAKERE